ncbi:MAG TPA: acyltransferase family protein [Solirubrobacterales bacterium]|jgi:peptidoglycan/LPS O-acetylase OafA/YrhL|nr:acyltransferase family protein [Solirubrobacterales bacterium]
MSRPQDSRFPYLPGIDALRALAVLAVFLYHARVGWLPGGFLGVDVFFVISGYLITSLLLREFRARGHVRLGRFWLRRARRLLPAVGVLIAVTMALAALFRSSQLGELRGDALASLFYFANWHFVFSHQSYFEQFQTPSLFTHLWSLSVEEQFYLFWPLVFAAGMKLFGRARLALGVLAGAFGSVVLAWILFDPGGDVSRAYYGTDTHAVGLLAGVALALVWSPIQLRRHPSGPLVGPILDLLGVLALGYVVLSMVHVHDYDLALWHGGYLWLALATALLIATLAHPAARLGGLLGGPAALWLGLRSYSFYLWHWPVLALTRPGVDISLPRGVLIPLQLMLVLALSDLSYRYVELPFRGKAPLPGLPDRRLRLARPALAAGVLAIVLFVGWSGLFGSRNRELEAAASTPTEAIVHASARAGPTHPPPATRPPRIVALGDSVMIGARDELAARLGPGFSMSAEVGRQASGFVEIVQRLKREGRHLQALIIQMGNNGPLYGEAMEALQKATTNVGQLFLVNDHAPVSWVGESNDALAEAAEDWPHTTLIDWASLAEAGAESWFWDGIHLTPLGAGHYARLVSRVVRQHVAFPAPPKAGSAAAAGPAVTPARSLGQSRQ